ncbi:hypothetical protein WJX84_010781, partial [Apatococcus fuscideae]
PRCQPRKPTCARGIEMPLV